DIASDPMHVGALRDRHLGLRDRALLSDIDGAAAKKMPDAHPFGKRGAARRNEILSAPLKPGRIIRPPSCHTSRNRSQSPASRQTTQFYDRANGEPIAHMPVHGRLPLNSEATIVRTRRVLQLACAGAEARNAPA